MTRGERWSIILLLIAAYLVGALSGTQYARSQVSIVGGLTGAGITPVSTTVGGNATFNTIMVAATGSGTTVLAGNGSRLSATVQNVAAVTVYCATSTAITTANSIALGPSSSSGSTLIPGGSMTFDRYTGLIQCLSSSGDADVRYIETTT